MIQQFIPSLYCNNLSSSIDKTLTQSGQKIGIENRKQRKKIPLLQKLIVSFAESKSNNVLILLVGSCFNHMLTFGGTVRAISLKLLYRSTRSYILLSSVNNEVLHCCCAIGRCQVDFNKPCKQNHPA